MELDRRSLLRRSGATMAISTGILSGCLGDDSDGESGGGDGEGDRGSALDTPSYARWLAWDEDEEATFYTYVDWAALEAVEDTGEPAEWGNGSTENELTNYEDAMVALPMAGILFAVFVGGFGLMGTGLSGLLSSSDEEMMGGTTDFETTVDEILMVNQAIVMAGDVQTDEIHDALTEEPEDEWSLKTTFEATESIGGFDVYEPGEAMSQGQRSAIAVGADAIVFADGSDGGDPVDDLRGPIEASAGDRERAADRNDDFEWLLGRAGHGDTVFGGYGEFEDEEEENNIDEGTELEELQGANGIVSSLTIESQTEWSGEFAAVFDDLDGEAEAELEAKLGSSAAEVSHEFDGNRVTASATWSEDLTEN